MLSEYCWFITLHITWVRKNIEILKIKICFPVKDAIFAKLTNFVCDNFNKTWFTIHECRLRAVNRNKTILNFNGTLYYPVNEALVNIQVLKKASGYKPWLFKISIDTCRFTRKAYNPIAILIFKIFREFSNINHTCPFIVCIVCKMLKKRYEYFSFLRRVHK